MKSFEFSSGIRGFGFAVFLSVVCAPCEAQVTWVVDAARGAGFHFDNVRAALAWAQSDDTIVVRAGQYREFVTIRRGARLLGDGRPSIDGMSIEGVPAGQFVTVSGFDLNTGIRSVSVKNCKGSVHIADSLRLRTAGFSVLASQAVTVQRCGPLRASVQGSRVLFFEASLVGGGNLLRGSVEFAPATPALDVQDGAVHLVHCALVGGRAGGNFAGAHALRVGGVGAVTIGGDASSSLRAGAGILPRSAIQADAPATLRLDPRVQLFANGSASAIEGSAKVERVEVPTLRGRGARPGAAFSMTLGVKPGAIYVLAFSGLRSVVNTPLGDYWLDPVQFVLSSGVVGASGIVTLRAQVPARASLRGLAIPFQALTLDRSVPGLTNGFVAVLN